MTTSAGLTGTADISYSFHHLIVDLLVLFSDDLTLNYELFSGTLYLCMSVCVSVCVYQCVCVCVLLLLKHLFSLFIIIVS